MERAENEIAETPVTIAGVTLPLKKWRKIMSSIEWDAKENAYHYLVEGAVTYIVHGTGK